MLQCTAVRQLPFRETLAQILTCEDPPDRPVLLAAGHALCELAERHDADHAHHLWEHLSPDHALWFRWNDTAHRFQSLPWCTALRGGDETCGLHADHPPPHSWDVHDPSRDAVLDEITSDPERWGLPPDPFQEP
ncbi:hypothetical protein [Streptomyces sp. NPDC054784]